MNVKQAKSILIQDLLASLGYRPVRERNGELWYNSPFRQETEASFKLTKDGKAWYDHGAGEGGNILDFVVRYYRLPDNAISEALRQLESLPIAQSGTVIEGGFSEPANAEGLAEPDLAEDNPLPLIVEKLGPLRHHALKLYLNRRGIPAALARPYVQEMHYRYEDNAYFALAFGSDSGGYELRNPYFKGCYGSKDITTIPADAGSHAVALFEGFVDFLSAIAYTGRAPEHHVIVLNSVAMRHRALAAVQRLEAPHLYLYLDHDGTGRELTAFFREQLPECEVVDASGFYADYKDLNEFWVAKQQAQHQHR